MTSKPLPFRRWAGLVFIAIVGSAFYGATLALVLRGWTLQGSALWLTLSAGFAWCVFIPNIELEICYEVEPVDYVWQRSQTEEARPCAS